MGERLLSGLVCICKLPDANEAYTNSLQRPHLQVLTPGKLNTFNHLHYPPLAPSSSCGIIL